MSSKSTPHIPTLDGWRAIAILSVIACHAGFLEYGYLGVEVFFGISGFLICTRLLDDELRMGRLDFSRFYVRRAFRILPPYLVYLMTLGLLTSIGKLAIEHKAIVSSVFFLQNFALSEAETPWYLGHFWSLAIEEHYYLLFPVILALPGKDFKNRSLILLVWALAIVVWRSVEFKQRYLSLFLPGVGFFTRTDVRLDALLLGALMAIVLKVPEWRKVVERWMAQSWALPVCALIFCAGAVYSFPLALLVRASMVPLMLAGTVLFSNRMTSSFLEMPALAWVGRMSYGLYLWNNFFLVPQSVRKVSGSDWLQALPFNLIALFVVASVSYSLIERPLIRWGYRFSRS